MEDWNHVRNPNLHFKTQKKSVWFVKNLLNKRCSFAWKFTYSIFLLHDYFRVLDKQNKGTLKEKDLRTLLAITGEEKMTADEISDLMNHLEKSDAGEISIEDLVSLLTG